MIQQGRGGRIIGACSETGKQGAGGGVLFFLKMSIQEFALAFDAGTIYCATKFAVRSLTQSAGQSTGLLFPLQIPINIYIQTQLRH
jgi:NAD(P)-dependent dehydrogenase (short-subunit alcohol dehydrogenase family)